MDDRESTYPCAKEVSPLRCPNDVCRCCHAGALQWGVPSIATAQSCSCIASNCCADWPESVALSIFFKVMTTVLHEIVLLLQRLWLELYTNDTRADQFMSLVNRGMRGASEW